MSIAICLDPGHGFKQNLGLDGYYESVGNLRACLLLKEELEKYGFEVVMTRTVDNANPDISTQRGQVAARNGCKVFISWHSDANAKASVRGVTVIRSLQRPKSVELGQKLAAAIAEAMGTPLSPYAGNDKGVWTRKTSSGADYYAVIRAAVAGDATVEYAYLVEHGFHTNPQDVAVLDSSVGRLKIVQAEAKALAEYFGLAGNTAPELPIPSDPPVTGGLYHVQAGAFSLKGNATAYAARLQKAGYKTVIKQDGKLYRVQLGAFAKKENAEAYAKQVKASGHDAIVKQ